MKKEINKPVTGKYIDNLATEKIETPAVNTVEKPETPPIAEKEPMTAVVEKNPVEVSTEKTREEIPEIQERPALTLVSDLDAYIVDRIKAQPKTLDEVMLVTEKKYAPGEHRLSLPKELHEYEDRFSFRWINKKKRAIDGAVTLKGWVLVNKALFPNLPKHLFTTNGGVEVGDAILAFMAKVKAEAIRRAPGEKSRGLLKSNPMVSGEVEPLKKGQSGFYKPEDTGEKGIEGLQEGRDF